MKHRLFCLLAAMAAMTGAASAARAQSAWNIGTLMQSMAQVRSASASFSESKTLPMLSQPLVTQGTLSYVAPDYVRKVTAAPVQQEFVLSGGEITLTTQPGNQTHRFSLAQEPAFGGLAQGIRATLAGDLPALELSYDLRLSGSKAGWQLLLTPKDPALRHFLAWMMIDGADNRITGIDTATGDGGVSKMQVTEDTLVPR